MSTDWKISCESKNDAIDVFALLSVALCNLTPVSQRSAWRFIKCTLQRGFFKMSSPGTTFRVVASYRPVVREFCPSLLKLQKMVNLLMTGSNMEARGTVMEKSDSCVYFSFKSQQAFGFLSQCLHTNHVCIAVRNILHHLPPMHHM